MQEGIHQTKLSTCEPVLLILAPSFQNVVVKNYRRMARRQLIRFVAIVVIFWVIFVVLRLPTPTPAPHQRTPTGTTDKKRERNRTHPRTVERINNHETTLPPPTVEVSLPPPTLIEADVHSLDSTTRPTTKTNFDSLHWNMVVEAIRHSWDSYKKFAWGYDEYRPLTMKGFNWGEDGKGIGVMMIDALDTLLLAHMHREANEVMDYIKENVTFRQDIKVSMFETTIRVLGGLLSAYQRTKRRDLLNHAKDLGDRLLPAFNTTSGIPNNYVNLLTGVHEGALWNGGNAILSEFGSLQLEFRTLSRLTRNPRYDRVATRAFMAIKGDLHQRVLPPQLQGTRCQREAQRVLGPLGTRTTSTC